MRMSKDMRNILAKMNDARATLNIAIADSNVDEAKKAQKQIEDLNELYDAARVAFENEQHVNTTPDTDPDDDDPPGVKDKITPKYTSNLFYNAITGKNLSDSERNIISAEKKNYQANYSEGSKENGGYTVPDDLSSQIYESIKSQDSVRSIVSVEPVKSLTGTRICKNGEPNKLFNTAESEEIKKMNNAKYGTVQYRQNKYAGLLPISTELMDDSFVNFVEEIKKWLIEASRITENAEVLYGAGGTNHCQGLLTTPGAFKEVTAPSIITIEYLRKVKFSLKSGYRATSKWIMNTDAFLELLELKDNNGRSYIQPDPTLTEQYVLLGSPIYILDDIVTDDGKTPILYGDASQAYRMFTRRQFGIAFTDVGAGAFETDTYIAKGIERFDGRIMDNNALVIIRDVPVTALTVNEPTNDFGASNEITNESLAYQTKPMLIELAEEMEIAGVNPTMTKSAIITAIMAAVNPLEETEDTPSGVQ